MVDEHTQEPSPKVSWAAAMRLELLLSNMFHTDSELTRVFCIMDAVCTHMHCPVKAPITSII